MSKVIEIIDSDEDTFGSVMPSNNTATTQGSPLSQSRRRPRKSALQALPDPDVQFETIAVDDDTSADPQDETNSTVDDNVQRPMQKYLKSTPNILAQKPPTNSELIDIAFEEYLDGPEGKESLEGIALERVRINQMLTLFGMPEIKFSLYAQPELLKFQLEERLKQHKILQNRNSGRGQGDFRSRGVVQDSSEQNT